MEGKLAELQDALTSEENKSKQEHRQRMKLEQTLADLEAKLEREMNVSIWRGGAVHMQWVWLSCM